MILNLIKIEDIKVVGLNTLCVIMLRLGDITPELSAILLMATIAYTIARTCNEIQKFKWGGGHDSPSSHKSD
jgi:hypothetical protein